MESGSARGSDLPPGFRFHPTDEELIVHYLCNQATSKPCPASIIPEVDIYKFDPWQLPEKAVFGENEWYFFTPRDRKYPNGVRPNRATVSGYWKATGTDKAIYSGAKHIGVKKALVFYKGKPPKGIKTDWIMHEYRLIGSPRRANKHIGSMRLDDWVLCRIYKKKHIAKSMDLLKEEIITEVDQYLSPEMNSITTEGNNNKMPNLVSEQQQMVKFPRTCSLAHLLDMDSYLAPISHLLSEASYNSTFDYQINTTHNNNNNNNYSGNLAIDPFLKPHHQVFEVPDQYYATSSSTTSQYL